MSHNQIYIIVIAIIAIIAMTACVTFHQKERAPKAENNTEIKSLYYQQGGNMLGDSYNVTLNNGLVNLSQCGGYGCKNYKSSRKATAEFFDNLMEIIEEYDMKSWTNLAEVKEHELDGSSTNVRIDFSDGTIIRFNSDKELPEGGWIGVRKLRQALDDFINVK